MVFSLRPLEPEIYPPGTFPIPRQACSLRVGREEGNDLQVSHSSVSALHARIECDGDETVEVVDCGSSNGTFVNGIRVSGRFPLAEGDLLRFATAEFQVAAAPGLNGDKAREIELLETLAQAEAEVAALKEALDGEQSLVTRLKREIEDAAQREQRHQAQLSETRRELMDREGVVASLRYEISVRDGNLRKLEEDRARVQEAYDGYVSLSAELEARLAESGEALAAERTAREAAERFVETVRRRALDLATRLLSDWRKWTGEGEGVVEDDDPESAFARVESLAEKIRTELDSIEPIWHEFGDAVQAELARRCESLRAEGADLLAETERRRGELDTVKASLGEFRKIVDLEVRRAQGLSRRGVHVEIPERFESMVIARDREQEIYRALVERLENLDLLLEGYRRSRKLRQVAAELGEFRDRLAAILEASGVKPFRIEPGIYLTLKHRREVQILSRKGWGTREYADFPFQPGEVLKVVRPGYQVGEGEEAVILRKVEVLIRGVDA